MNLCDKLEILTDFIKLDKKYLTLDKEDKIDFLVLIMSAFKEEVDNLKSNPIINKDEFNKRYYNFYEIKDIIKIVKTYNILSDDSFFTMINWCTKSKANLFKLRLSSTMLLIDDGLEIMGESIKKGSYII